MIPTDRRHPQHLAFGVAWALSMKLSPRLHVRLAADDHTNTYPSQVPIDGPAPQRPWAMYLADAHGHYRYLGLDLDAHQGGVQQVQQDTARIRRALDDAGIAHTVCESGPSGGQHIWIALATGVDQQLVRHVAHSLQGIAPSLDPTPLLNAATGCLRPPGAPHRDGGTSHIIAGSKATLIHPATTPEQLVALASALNTATQNPAREPQHAELRLPTDDHGRPWLPGPRRPLPQGSRNALNEHAEHTPDASRVLYIALLGAAAAHWHYNDLIPLLDSAPGMEHARSQRIRHGAADRRPRPSHGAQSPQAVLGRLWQAAVRFVATHERRAGNDPSFDPRAEAIAAVVDRLQRRADASTTRWRRGGGPADRRILDILCLLALQAVTPSLEADIRRLALLTGLGRETARTALIRLADDHWIAQAQPAAGTRAATWTIDPQDAIHADLNTARSQGAARPAGAGSQWRNLLLDQFTTRFNLARHDIFTSPHALGLAAGLTYARLNEPGTTPDQEHLYRLAVAGLIVMTPDGWQRTALGLRDLAAQRHGVAGRLTQRQQRYASERDQWSWWNAELDWMTTPGRHRRRRQPTGQIALSLGQPWDMYPPYPRRADGRADHRAARTMIAGGILDPLHHATLATAA
jgi:hypothetical protein